MEDMEAEIVKQELQQSAQETKFCQQCGASILKQAVVCPQCGCQTQEIKSVTPNIVIQNTNMNANSNVNVAGAGSNAKNKWTAFLLCLFLGYFGAHKFYEGKTGMGVLYLFTLGLCGIGWIVDMILLLLKPNPYYV